jgi:DUF1680 family protein
VKIEIAPQNGYLILKRAFSAGDSIQLSLPLKLRLVPEAAGVMIHYGALLLALPIAAETRIVRGTMPFADREFLPREEWRFGIAEECLAEAVITRCEPGELPFDDASPPLSIQLPLVPAPQWRKRQNSAGEVPEPFAADGQMLVNKTLIPYGCTQLRVAQFPIVTLKEKHT